MIKIDVENKNELLSSVASCAYEVLALEGDCFVELDFVSRDEIHELNLRTRGVDRATDVLSYPALDEIMPFTKNNYPFEYVEGSGVSLGSIIICEEVAIEQAKEYGHSETRERAYLFLRGLLHLLGYDHIEEQDKKLMREKEEAVLSALNVTRE